jgi:hypothetical protein
MIKHVHARRAFSAVLAVLGGVLMFLAPEHVWIGAVMVVLGVGIELIGIAVMHGRKDNAI